MLIINVIIHVILTISHVINLVSHVIIVFVKMIIEKHVSKSFCKYSIGDDDLLPVGEISKVYLLN